MASINGVEIKSLKTFRDHEGCEAVQGNVYIDGKKTGFWSQDGWGGPDTFEERTEDRVTERAEQFAKGYPKDAKYAEYAGDSNVFMQHLLELSQVEKIYKKYQKDGWVALVYATDNYHQRVLAFRKLLSEAEIKEKYPKDYESLFAEMFRNVVPKVYVVHGLDDFNVIVDVEHPAPSYLVD